MALREIRIDGDPLLRKRSREVKDIDEKINILIDDMIDTMNEAQGIGLAAPQVGTLRRVIVMDIGEGPIAMVNPVIIKEDGEEIAVEGCLSIPEFRGTVKRPKEIEVEYISREGAEEKIVAEDLLARVICHEIDHLNGVLFKDIFIEEVEYEEVYEEDENLDEEI